MARMCDNICRVYAEYNILDVLGSAGRITVTGQEHLAALRDRNRPILVFPLSALQGGEGGAPARRRRGG
jgi:hypothetical protein